MSVGSGGNMSHYPGGFPGGLSVRNVPLISLHPGNVFWVDSGGAQNSRGTFNKPYLTITAALARCTAANGDIILCKPGHAETLATDGAIDISKSGVAVVGLGKGALRPTLTIGTLAAAALAMSGANTLIQNFRFVAAIADITNMIDVTAADVHIDSCEFVESAADLNWLDVIAATGADNTADGLTLTNNRAFGIDAGCNSFLNITGDIDRLIVNDNFVVHDHANALAFILQATGKAMTNIEMLRNSYHSLKTSGDVLVDNDVATNSGIAAYNTASHADTAGEVLIDADGVGLVENRGTGVITASGYVLPAIDS